MANWLIEQKIDLRRGEQAPQVWPNALMLCGDNNAHTWRVTVLDGGEAAQVTGSVTGYFVRPDGNTVTVQGSMAGNVASVVLAQACYAQEGAVKAVMRLSTADGAKVTLAAMILPVRNVLTDSIIDPDNVIPSLEDLLAQVAAMEALNDDVSAAEAGRVAAEQGRVQAEQEREATIAQIEQDAENGEYDGATFLPAVSADGVISWTNDKGLANPASVNIKGADGEDGLSVELRLSDAYLQWRPTDGVWQNLIALFEITGPAGADGADGQNPTISIGTVTRAETTSEASATLTGTYPAYVLNLVLPKGDTGATGATGPTGPKGDDGVSPTISVSKSGKITTITIVDAEGTHTATINDGADGSGTGDMLAATYDADGDGIVDDAEKLGGQLPGYYAKASDVPSVPAWALSGTKPSYTAQEVGAAAAEHTHEQGEITGLETTLAGKAAVEHTHEQADIAGLSNALAGKASTEHTHTQSDVTGLETALAGKVNAESGKGLSTNDYTTSEKDKLAGIEAGANNYVHPSTHPASMIAAGTLAGQVQANATAVESLATAQVRNIRAGTADLTPGESALASGEVYLVYE